MEQQLDSPSVVPRSDIPLASAAEALGLEVRPFLAHEVLSSILPPSSVALAWTHAPEGSDVALRSHPTRGLLIILEGRATLNGGLRRLVEAGDVITLPSHHEYGFTDVGEGGLHALHVAFPDEQQVPTDATSLEQLLSRNDARIQVALNNPFFSLLRQRGIDRPGKRATMRECLRVFADAFQTFLFTRQATCRDDDYALPFHEHLVEELGHNKLLAVSGKSPIAADPILRATASWFCHQMLVLDNSEKAVVNLVLESAGYYLGTLAGPLFEGHASAGYFETHGEDDARHRELGLKLLEGHHPQTYARLQRVLDSSWDMLDAMTRRFAAIIEREAKSS